MMNNRRGLSMDRRHFLGTVAATSVSIGLSSPLPGQVCLPRAGTVRDKLWLFSNPTNADYGLLRKRSVMSPFEAAVYMGIPNIFMVQQYPQKGQESWYKPWTPPLEQYALPLTMLKRVAWSLVGASGVTKESERKEVLAMALKTPNFVGVYLDDFFHNNPGEGTASLTLGQLKDIQHRIKSSTKNMDIYVTFYDYQLSLPHVSEYLSLIDVITLWTWKTEELAKLDSHLAQLERLMPKSRIMLGVYTVALNEKNTPAWTGMPIPLMRDQCEQALEWLRSGRIEGIIVYGGTTLDLGFESVNWTREWIQKVADKKL